MSKEFNKREWELKELPNSIFIETFMGCNLRCKMCPVSDSETYMEGRKFHEMSLDVYKEIINQISDSPRRLHLNQLGEPLLNKNIVEFVKLAKENKHRVGLTSNGSRMNEELAKQLLLAGLDEITFSIDGFKKETYENIRIGAKYEEVVSNVKKMCELNDLLRKRDKCLIRVDCILSDLTEPELDDMRRFWNGSVELNFIPLDNWANQLEIPNEFGERRSITDRKSKRYPCDLLWTSLDISAEGKVIYCCHDYKLNSKLPSVLEKPLEEIWAQELANERHKHVTNNINSKPCSKCDAWMTRPEYYRNPTILDRVRNKLTKIISLK